MAQKDSRSWPDRLYRITLILAAAVVFGVLLYWVAPDLTPYFGENGAALWSWSLIFASGIAAHRLLPRTNLTPVSRVLFGLLTSAVVAMLFTWILTLVLDLSFDEGEFPQVLLVVGITAFVLASILFIPIHRMRKKLGRAVPSLYFLTATVIPAVCVFVWRPLGTQGYLGNLLFAGLACLIGGSSAIGFSIATSGFRDVTEAEQ